MFKSEKFAWEGKTRVMKDECNRMQLHEVWFLAEESNEGVMSKALRAVKRSGRDGLILFFIRTN